MEIIQKTVDTILQDLEYHEPVIRDDIFKLLRKKGKVIFYPLPEEPELDGFHVQKVVNGKLTAFVYINTAKNFEKCIFCGAHELGHIYEVEKEIQKEYPEVQFTIEETDNIMNRFAAELLMPEDKFKEIFHKRIFLLGKKWKQMTYADLLKTIVALMDYFYVPYKAIVWRLHEIGLFTDAGKVEFEEIEKNDREIINSYIYEGKYTRLRTPSNLKSFENLPEYLRKAEEEDIFRREKINRIRMEFDIEQVASGEKLDAKEKSKLESIAINKEFLDGK